MITRYEVPDRSAQGLLAEAQANAAKLTEALLPVAERGEKIVFCEPSCLSAVKEDKETTVAELRARIQKTVTARDSRR